MYRANYLNNQVVLCGFNRAGAINISNSCVRTYDIAVEILTVPRLENDGWIQADDSQKKHNFGTGDVMELG